MNGNRAIGILFWSGLTCPDKRTDLPECTLHPQARLFSIRNFVVTVTRGLFQLFIHSDRWRKVHEFVLDKSRLGLAWPDPSCTPGAGRHRNCYQIQSETNARQNAVCKRSHCTGMLKITNIFRNTASLRCTEVASGGSIKFQMRMACVVAFLSAPSRKQHEMPGSSGRP